MLEMLLYVFRSRKFRVTMGPELSIPNADTKTLMTVTAKIIQTVKLFKAFAEL